MSLSIHAKAQNSIDMVKYTFKEGMRLDPEIRSITITINRNESSPTIRVEVDRSSMDDLIRAELTAMELLRSAKTRADTLAVRAKVKQENMSDSTFAISVSQFDRIENLLFSLDEKKVQMSLAATEGTDGTSGYLMFRAGDKHVRYDLWSPDHQTKKRGLESLLKAIDQILLTGLIEPKDVWN